MMANPFTVDFQPGDATRYVVVFMPLDDRQRYLLGGDFLFGFNSGDRELVTKAFTAHTTGDDLAQQLGLKHPWTRQAARLAFAYLTGNDAALQPSHYGETEKTQEEQTILREVRERWTSQGYRQPWQEQLDALRATREAGR